MITISPIRSAKYLSKSSPPCMHSSADFIHLHEFHGGKKTETVPGPAIGRTLRPGKNLRPPFWVGKNMEKCGGNSVLMDES